METEERYLFDLMGFLVLPQVLTREEVAEPNALIDSYDLWRKAKSGEEPAWVNDPNFMTVGAPHTWDEPFRRLLAHPKIMPYLKTLVGPKFRYDHGHALLMRSGAKQLGLHGGATPWDPAQEYRYRDGEILNGLVVVSYALSDASAVSSSGERPSAKLSSTRSDRAAASSRRRRRDSDRNQSSAVVRAIPSSQVRALPRCGSNRLHIRSAFSNVELARSSAVSRSRVR